MMTTTTTTTRWWWCAASLRMEQVLTFDWQHWPLSFEAQAQAELALVNGLAALYKLAQLQLYASCPVGPTSPPSHLHPPPASNQSIVGLKLIPPYVTRTTPARYPFLIALRFVFIFIFIFLVSFSFSRSHSASFYFYYISCLPPFSHCPPLLWVSWKKLYYTSITTPGHDNK